MTDGLQIICSPGGYYPYVRIGWCQIDGVFIRMYNCRVLKKFGSMAELANLAKDGPATGTRLLSMSKEEGVCVAAVSRNIPCDAKNWAKECPKPEGFDS